MRTIPVLLSAVALYACDDADGGPVVDPATIGEQRALDDAREMIEQHAAPEDGAAETREEADE